MEASEPCPFDLGLRKFALDPTLVIFLEMKKLSLVWDLIGALIPYLIFFGY